MKQYYRTLFYQSRSYRTLFYGALATVLCSGAGLSAQAATELTPEQAAALKPFDRITFTGRFSSIIDAARTVSAKADKRGASGFYILDTNSVGNSGNWRVVADIYHKDAPKAEPVKNRIINGVTELSKQQAISLEPFDTVTLNGLFHSQSDVNTEIAKAAKAKGAASFYIVRQVDVNSSGSNQRITAFIYKADAKTRRLQSADAIPADSVAGRAALAAGGSEAKKVEIPGVASDASFSSKVGRFFETQSSKGGRYTVTLPDGTKIQELNKFTAAQMVPFDNIKFRGSFANITEVSYQVAKRAAKKGAKYYHITREWQEHGNNMIISADLYK